MFYSLSIKPSYHVGKTYWVQRKINKKTNLPLTKLLKTYSFKVKIKQPHLTFFFPSDSKHWVCPKPSPAALHIDSSPQRPPRGK